MTQNANFQLYHNQAQTLQTEANEILYGGAMGGGKSYLARVAAIYFSIEVPGLITYLFRRTYKEILSNHIYTPGGFLEMLKPLIESDDVKWSKSDNSLEFENGSRIQLAHSQYEGDVYQYQGAQIGLLIIDEATHFTPFMVGFLRSRVRLGSLSVPQHLAGQLPRILYGSNPGGVGHHYFKKNFVDYGPYTVHKAPKNEGGMRRVYIPSKLTDNKVMMMTDPDYIDRVRGMGDAKVVQAMIDGDWEILSGGKFSDVWHPKFHVLAPFTIPKEWRIDRCYDYGSSAPAVCIWFAESNGETFNDSKGTPCWVPSGTLFAIDELYFADEHHKGLKLSGAQQGQKIHEQEARREWYHRVKAGPADSSIFSAEPEQDSIAEQMEVAGVNFVRSDKSSGSRIRGVDLMRGRLQGATNRPMELPGIFFFNTCDACIRTIPNLEGDKKNTEDVDTKGEDHCWDVVRYRLLRASNVVRTGETAGT